MSTPAQERVAALDAARHAVTRATSAVEHARLEDLPLSERRSRDAALRAALDAAVAAAGAAGPRHAGDLERLRIQRELHSLAGLSTAGIRVPTCERTSTLQALGPRISGMTSDAAPAHGQEEDRTYGLDLVAHLDRAGADLLDRSALTGATGVPDPRRTSENALQAVS